MYTHIIIIMVDIISNAVKMWSTFLHMYTSILETHTTCVRIHTCTKCTRLYVGYTRRIECTIYQTYTLTGQRHFHWDIGHGFSHVQKHFSSVIHLPAARKERGLANDKETTYYDRVIPTEIKLKVRLRVWSFIYQCSTPYSPPIAMCPKVDAVFL